MTDAMDRKSEKAPLTEYAYPPVVGFMSAKAAQVAAYFVAMAGGRIEKLKLAKLGYLAERRHLDRYDTPITYDELYSLPHGPICSHSLNGIDGKTHDSKQWNRISPHGRGLVVGKSQISREEVDELNDAEVETLEGVWAEFGKFSGNQLRAWTHEPDNVPEYVDVGEGRRMPIDYREMLKALGKSDEVAQTIVDRIASHRRLENILGR